MESVMRIVGTALARVSSRRTTTLLLVVLTILLSLTSGRTTRAQDDAESPAGGPEGPAPASVVDLVRSSGGIGLTILLLSIAAVALVLEHIITIRRQTMMPPGLAQDLHAHITAGEFRQAEQACKLRPSYLSYVVLAGLQEVRMGYAAVEKGMENASQEQAARLFRKVEYLALIGNIAPMLGLLGTVYGILLAFKRVAESEGMALAADLADGVYLALVTTVEGLVVAIPTLSAFAIFRGRVEQLASEVNILAERVFVNYKHGATNRPLGLTEDDAKGE